MRLVIAGIVALVVAAVIAAWFRRPLRRRAQIAQNLPSMPGSQVDMAAFCAGDVGKKTNEDVCDKMSFQYKYDPVTKACTRFASGGCIGYPNAFSRLSACQAAVTKYCTPAACAMPIDPGPCRAKHKQFAWDAKQQACRQFIYGGCGGNANNFGSLNECQRACEPSTPAPNLAPT